MMDLAAGHRVLDVGCGTGRNFPLLEGAVGPEGRIYGVDFSSGMLDEAHRLCVKRKWRNVTLVEEDATTYTVPDMVNSVLFSLCYGTMANRVEALAHAWRFLKRGGNLVVFDGRIPESMIGRAINGYTRWLSRKTVLANPYTRPWDDLRRVASDISDIEIKYLQLGTYYIFRARKS
jgi:ubiquinone/menaquinone biosynthesis C-methylase UbiE